MAMEATISKYREAYVPIDDKNHFFPISFIIIICCCVYYFRIYRIEL